MAKEAAGCFDTTPIHQCLPGRFFLIWIYILMTCSLSSFRGEESRPGVIQEYCDTEGFMPVCKENEVVRMVSARYGRMQLGRCVETDIGYVGCSSNVIDLMDSRCSGRKTCEVRIPDSQLESTRPCFKELKTFLEASFICVEVATRDAEECHRSGFINVTSSSGWLSSYVSLSSGCGSAEHPWVIQALPRQKINLTLYDFSIDASYVVNDVSFSKSTQACKEYALIFEWNSKQNAVVCGGVRREQHIMLSSSNAVEIKLTNNNDKYFLLRYEVVGCADLPSPVNGWFERKETGAVVGCYHSNERWHLTCTGTTWIGDVGNCSAPPPGFEAESPHYDIALPIGASVAIILGAAVGVGLVVVVVGLIRFKRTCHQARGYETPNRETILLREKGGGPPNMDIQPVDSGHCSMDAGVGEIQTEETPPPTARIGFVRHQRVIKINGNDYAHIWEAPLPEPSTSRPGPAYRTMIRAPIGGDGCTCMYHIKPAMCPVPPPTTTAVPHEGVLGPTTVPAPNTVAQPPAQCDSLKFGTANRRPQAYPKSPNSYEPPRYSTLDRKGLYGNSSSV